MLSYYVQGLFAIACWEIGKSLYQSLKASYYAFTRQPEYYEYRTMKVADGEHLMRLDKSWEYQGYGIGDTIHLRRKLNDTP